VGFVYGIILSMTQSDMWIVDQVTVKRGGREEVNFVPKELAWIKCPAKCSITIMNPKPGFFITFNFLGKVISLISSP
jgi:hypothetical protein